MTFPGDDPLQAIDAAASNLAKLLPAAGQGLTWADVIDDNELDGQWLPNDADLAASVRDLLLQTYRRDGATAAARLIESSSRLADHRHRSSTGDARFLLAQLEVYVRMLGVPYSQVMGAIRWREFGPALTDAAPHELSIEPFDLEPLRKLYDRLRLAADRQAAGLKFERLLWRLFDLHQLEPTQGFRVEGQQIDDSFRLRGSIYLLEAKWTADKLGAKEIHFFDHKIKSKSRNTRGLMVSVAGYTDQALREYRTNGLPAALLIDGGHLARVLNGEEGLDHMLSRLSDHFDRTGVPYLPV